MVVRIHAAGLFRDRVAVHYLRPARTIELELVQIGPREPTVAARREFPEACLSVVHLENDDPLWDGAEYSVHSSLKQVPVDPTHAVLLSVSVRWRKDGDGENFSQEQILNGLSRAELGDARVSVTAEVLPPAEAPVETPEAADPAAVGPLLQQLRDRGFSPTLLREESDLTCRLPASFSRRLTGPAGEHLNLYPDHSYTFSGWTGRDADVSDERGRWTFAGGLLALRRTSDGSIAKGAPIDRWYLLLNPGPDLSGNDSPVLLGARHGLEALLADSGRTPPDPAGALRSAGLSPAPVSAAESDSPAAAANEAWSRLEDRFHVDARSRSLERGTFVLEGDATLELADIRLLADRIEISADLSELTLPGPVGIDWAGRRFNAEGVVVRVTPFRIRIESQAIRTAVTRQVKGARRPPLPKSLALRSLLRSFL